MACCEELQISIEERLKSVKEFLNNLNNKTILDISSISEEQPRTRSWFCYTDFNGVTHKVYFYGFSSRFYDGRYKRTVGGVIYSTRLNIIKELANSDHNLYYKTLRLIRNEPTIENFNNVKSEILRQRKEAKRLEDKAFKDRLYDRFNPSMKVKDFILKTDISIGRVNTNKNRNTFDYIDVGVMTPTNFKGDKKKYIKEHLREIYSLVCNKLSQYKFYTKYGVPVNYLKVNNVTLACDGTLLFKLGLKGEKHFN